MRPGVDEQYELQNTSAGADCRLRANLSAEAFDTSFYCSVFCATSQLVANSDFITFIHIRMPPLVRYAFDSYISSAAVVDLYSY